jgi:hypothetical protein
LIERTPQWLVMGDDNTDVLSLPDNALLAVFSSLDVHGVCAASQVCSRLQLLAAQVHLSSSFAHSGHLFDRDSQLAAAMMPMISYIQNRACSHAYGGTFRLMAV